MQRVDHTLLRPTATRAEVLGTCAEALRYGAASACIPPCYVKTAKETFQSLRVCTVVGFPLGYSTIESKIAEIVAAKAAGADEFDIVINQGYAADGRFEDIHAELCRAREACGEGVMKVIIETCNLRDEQKIALCEVVGRAKADYIKTSTGFGAAGAAMADILLFKAHLPAGVKIKAAGGIRTREDMEAFVAAGCDRLGTSSAVKILFENEAADGY